MDVHPTKNVSIGIDPYPDLLGQDTSALPGLSHLKDLELSIEIRRSPGPGAFFSTLDFLSRPRSEKTPWRSSSHGVISVLSQLMGAYYHDSISIFPPQLPAAPGGPRRPSSARSSEKVSCLPNLLMA
jgi:hypothetical protein